MFDVRAMISDETSSVMSWPCSRAVRSPVWSGPYSRFARLQMVDQFTQYVGSAPAASPAVLCGIAHAQTREGVSTRWVGRGLPRRWRAWLSLAASRSAAMGARGENRHGKRSGRRFALADGPVVEVDAVVSNCDSARTYRDLVGGAAALHLRSDADTNRPARVSSSTWA